MKCLLKIRDLTESDVNKIFDIADNIESYKESLKGKKIAMFFPDTSVRTLTTFETAVKKLGGDFIMFPSNALDKEEPMKDVAGYMNNWVDGMVVRHGNDLLQEELAQNIKSFYINAMSKSSHPCEILADLYALRKRNIDIKNSKFVFVGPAGNIGNSYYEASVILGYSFVQVCKHGDEIEGATVNYECYKAFKDADIILTDSLGKEQRIIYQDFIINDEKVKYMKKGVMINPCPPFHRGYEISETVLDSDLFVGYDFKAALEGVQSAIILFLNNDMET